VSDSAPIKTYGISWLHSRARLTASQSHKRLWYTPFSHAVLRYIIALHQTAADNRVRICLNGWHFIPQSTTTKLKCISGCPFGVMVAAPLQSLATL
jgi:hypothetical protein